MPADEIAEVNEKLDLHLRVERLKAIDVLLATPDDISDGLEAELYAFRDHINGLPVPEG